MCGSSLAKFAVKYSMDRSCFEDGAFYINFENQFSESSLLYCICKNIGYLGFGSSDLQRAIQPIKNQRILLIIDNLEKLIEKYPEKLMNLLKDFMRFTLQLKIILITNKTSIKEIKDKFDDEDII